MTSRETSETSSRNGQSWSECRRQTVKSPESNSPAGGQIVYFVLRRLFDFARLQASQFAARSFAGGFGFNLKDYYSNRILVRYRTSMTAPYEYEYRFQMSIILAK